MTMGKGKDWHYASTQACTRVLCYLFAHISGAGKPSYALANNTVFFHCRPPILQ